MYDYLDDGRPVHRPPSLADYQMAKNEYEEHTGFCLGPYKPETCNSCYCELECLELRVRELMEYVV